ncbi:MAG: DEAD/DEAH box helicase family protein [Clostridia bacterium]|nr:DEAD/DEAH box helicase family protein [Clostridia bacterium]
MMNIKLKDFQEHCVEELLEQTAFGEKEEILIQAPTGSGKTVILLEYIDRFLMEHDDYVFIWLTPGSGELEEQSMKKMNELLPGLNTKTLEDVLNTGFEKQDTAFINWENVTKKGNTALKELEKSNLYDRVEQARDDGLKFIVIIDEEHRNKTEKAEGITHLFSSEHIVRVSATTKRNDEAYNIKISEMEVINSGLITKSLYINQGIEDNIVLNNEIEYLLKLAINKRREIRKCCTENGINYNPLVIIQLPSMSEELIEQIEGYLKDEGFTYDNGLLAIWLADRKENIDNISDNEAEQCFLIMKQAISTGWDCPRAKVLVKIRENMHEDFEIQTLGRIRRMPEAKHYGNELLDNCYLYTFDDQYTESVKQELGRNAANVKALFVRDEYRKFKLTKEVKNTDADNFAPREAFYAMYEYFNSQYNLTKPEENKEKLEKAGYNFNQNITNEIVQGNAVEINKKTIIKTEKISIQSTVDTYKNGLDLRHSINVIASRIGMIYQYLSPILQRLFLANIEFPEKILKLNKKEFYAFIINNERKLEYDILDAVIQKREQRVKLQKEYKKTEDFYFPERITVKYDKKDNSVSEMCKNVYYGYPSTTLKSTCEEKFEKYCEKSERVKFWYKNGESSDDYFSIVYLDKMNKAWTFYPDYIVGDNEGNIWIIETKGGEDSYGHSKNIDIKVENKFQALKVYAEKYNLKWGFIRDIDDVIFMSNGNEYVEDMKDNSWTNVKFYL